MQGKFYTAAFTKFLADCVKRGMLRRVANAIFESILKKEWHLTTQFNFYHSGNC